MPMTAAVKSTGASNSNSWLTDIIWNFHNMNSDAAAASTLGAGRNRTYLYPTGFQRVKIPFGVKLITKRTSMHHFKTLQLKITLWDTKPAVWRRLLVPDYFTFYQF